MSTGFHPDTDGLSENPNKTVVRNLRSFATHDLANWTITSHLQSILMIPQYTARWSRCLLNLVLAMSRLCHYTWLQISSGRKPMNQRKHYNAANSLNNCVTLWEPPGMNHKMLRMNGRQSLITHDIQLTTPSLLVWTFFEIEGIGQSQTPKSILRDVNW